MSPPKRANDSVSRMQSMLSAAERMSAHQTEWESGQISEDSRDSAVASSLEAILATAQPLLQSTQDLLEIIKSAEGSSASFPNMRDYWSFYRKTVLQLEQLQWLFYDRTQAKRSRRPQVSPVKNGGYPEAVDIQLSQDSCLIKMPHIPATKNSGYHMAEDLLWDKLTRTDNLPKWKSCHAAFCHVYPMSVKQMPKDVDNYDYKRTIDILSCIFGFPDCPEFFSMEMTSFFSDNIPYGTYILLNPNLPKKLEEHLKQSKWYSGNSSSSKTV